MLSTSISYLHQPMLPHLALLRLFCLFLLTKASKYQISRVRTTSLVRRKKEQADGDSHSQCAPS